MGRRTHGEGSVYQRASDGRWVYARDLGWIGGKRDRRTRTAKTLRELRPKIRELDREIEQGVLSDSSTVEQWLNYWLDNIAARDVRERTLVGYRGYVNTWLIPHLGKRRLDKLRPDHILALYAAMETAGKSDATRRQAHAILRRALKIAMHHGRIASNPAERVTPPPVGKGSHGSLTLDEAVRVLKVLDDGWPQASRWACALFAGLRQAEALGLKWEDVDLDGAVLHVRRGVQRIKGKGLVETPTKSQASRRAVPLVPQVVRALRMGNPGDGYVWGGDKPTDPRRDWQAWKDLLEAAGVESRPLHAARATTGSLLMAAGVPDVIIAEILGHSEVRVTQRHYLHGDVRQHREAMAALDALVEAARRGDAMPEIEG